MSNQQPQNIQLSLSQYRYLYCVDLEATCDELMPGEASRGLVVTPGEMETIELGLVVIDQRERRVVDSFQSFVRPRLHPRLTPFCRQLTTIEQCEIDSAPGFVDAMQRLNDFSSGYAALPGCLGVSTMLFRYAAMEPSIKPAACSKPSHTST